MIEKALKPYIWGVVSRRDAARAVMTALKSVECMCGAGSDPVGGYCTRCGGRV